MADAVKGLMDRITNEDPETRGQQLWVMFALAMFLVATLNWYAYVRELKPLKSVPCLNTKMK